MTFFQNQHFLRFFEESYLSVEVRTNALSVLIWVQNVIRRRQNLTPLQWIQGSHRLEKYLNLEGFLEKSLKIKSALKRTGKSLKGLEKSLNSTIFCRT